MSATPRHPHEVLLAKLTQAMSAPGAPVRHDLGQQAAAQNRVGDRLEWIPSSLMTGERAFQLPGRVTPADQVVSYEVNIHASSYGRLLELHRLLVGSLELLVGPESGSAPSDDAGPAVLIGVTDLAALVYPYSGLIGLTLDVVADGLARSLALPGAAVADPQAIVTALNIASNAIVQNGLNAHFRLHSYPTGEQYLGVYSATTPIDPFSTGAEFALDPSPTTSACAILGFSAGAGNLSARGTPPSSRYRPGYRIEESDKPTGGNLGATEWAVTVPVTLYTPIEAVRFLVGTIQTVPIAVTATDGQGPPETITNP